MRDPRPGWSWGVPDWRDEGAYPKPDDLNSNDWRWEFTRRRPDYREAWLLYAEKTYRANVEIAQTLLEDDPKKRNLLENIDDPDFHACRRNPAEMAAEDYPDDWPWIRDPAASGPKLAFEHQTYGRVLYDSHDAYFVLPRRVDPEDIGHIAITFDLTKPWKQQNDAARRAFDYAREDFIEEFDLQFEKRRQHQDKWPLYLRIIDAQEANPIWKVGCPTFEGKLTWEEIGETLLLPDPETVSQEEYDRLLSDKVAEKAQNTWKQAQVVMNNFPTSEVLAA
jgi:hypothetical protein